MRIQIDIDETTGQATACLQLDNGGVPTAKDLIMIKDAFYSFLDVAADQVFFDKKHEKKITK